MKILMLNYEFPPLGGGAANANYYLLKEFSKDKDIKIDLITSSVSKYRVNEFSDNINIYFLDIGKNKNNYHYQKNKDLIKYSIKAYNFAKKLLKNNKYDLIHAFFGIPCGYIAMKLGLLYIVSLRGSDVPFYNERFKVLDKLFFKRLSKKIWKKANSVAANSDGLRKLALRTFDENEISVIYNGVDTNEFYPSENKAVNRKKKIISIGRLIRRKGFEYLIKALKGIEDIELDIVGDGVLLNNLKQIAANNKIQVNFLGNRLHNEIVDLYQRSDFFILPSLNEGMSNAVLEAMACGLPIIVTDVGGSKELVRDNGFVVEKGSVSSLNKAIQNYIKEPDLIIKHGKRSREIAESMSWPKVSDEYLKEYSRILADG